MLKITDMIVSAILKKGILYEARNCDVEFEIPAMMKSENGEVTDEKIKVHFKAENMKLTIEKE